MKIDFGALLKSKIVWANILGLAVAVGAVFGVTPEMSGQTEQYAAAGLMILNIILRVFFSGTPIANKVDKIDNALKTKLP